MRVVINRAEVQLAFVEVKISIDKLTRQFTIKDVNDLPDFYLGDDVLIYDETGALLVAGEIEYVGIEQERTFVYAGRNAAKYVVDSFAEKTIQFVEGQNLANVLSPVAKGFGLRVHGSAIMPKDIKNTILVGDNLGKAFMNLAKYSAVILTSDAKGDIYIEEGSPEGGAKLEYGENIRKREYKQDTTLGYDRYVVVSQSNYIMNPKQDVNVKGSFGTGKSVKVIRANSNLTIRECNALAEREYKKDRRKSLIYKVDVDRSLGVQVNHVYSIIDKVANINYRMRAKEVVLTIDAKTDKTIATFERLR